MRLGIRQELALALSGLLVLGLVPLFVAWSSLTRTTMLRVREESARALGRAVAAHVAEARAHRPLSELPDVLEAELGAGGVAALVAYDPDGAPVAAGGDAEARAALPSRAARDREVAASVSTPRGSAVVVVVPSPAGAVATLMRTDEDTGRVAPLVRLVALYTGLVALGLLVLAHFALTRLLVRPIDALSRAAARVADGARTLDAPSAGPAELVELGASLASMTAKLRADEALLREQIGELERRAHELTRAQDGLVRSERLASVGRLAAGLAHEIGNPIAALMAIEELLLAGGLDAAEQQDFLERMRRETERVHGVLRDLLDFARPATASAAEPSEPSDARDAIDDAVGLVRPQPAFRDLVLDVRVAPGSLAVALPRERLVQVLLNLLLNAADACRGEGRVELVAELRGDRVRLTVGDEGPGVAPAVVAHLFEPFVTTKDVGKGTGLGLAVCRGIVEEAGGTITLDRSAPRGARFVVELPLAREADA